jgi:hypothetical protein
LRPFGLAAALFSLFSLAALAGCSSVSEALYPPGAERAEGAPKESHRQRVVANEFQWAVQNYEAGKYEEALGQFRRLRELGAESAAFELVPYYLGMSLFKLSRYDEASVRLAEFLRGQVPARERQEARLALLSIHERTAQWDQLAALAAETDRLTLFQDNRAFVKLLWARALRERGELQGARQTLKDAEPYLDGERSTRATELDRDLWGRYHFTAQLLRQTECLSLQPRALAGKTKKAPPKRLYGPWLEASVDCFRSTVKNMAAELFALESAWAPLAATELEKALTQWGATVQGFLKQESARLEQKRALQSDARQHIYRLMSEIDRSIQVLSDRSLKAPGLESLRRHLDLLLSSLS